MRYSALVLLFLISTYSFSQDYKRVSVGLGMGYVYGGDYRAGVLLYMESSYRFNNVVAVGLKMEGLLGNLDGQFSGTRSYSLNTKYYFLANRFQPFVGLGAGVYFSGVGFLLKCDCSRSVEPTAGFYPRLGFEFGHLVFNVEYNILATSKVTVTSGYPGIYPGVDSSSTEYVRSNYMSTKIGFFIGGGRKRK